MKINNMDKTMLWKYQNLRKHVLMNIERVNQRYGAGGPGHLFRKCNHCGNIVDISKFKEAHEH